MRRQESSQESSVQRVAIIFDNTRRQDTTGVHCLRALEKIVDVRHFLPSQLADISPNDFGLYLCIDDGLRYEIPKHLRPNAWWAIDTHLDFDWYRDKSPEFDFVFTAQQDGAERLREEGAAEAVWLPLACDPQLHRRHDVSKQFDVCFVGSLYPGDRSDLLSLIRQSYRNTFSGQCYGDEMARVYSASRVVFNRSVKNDVNMRVFEALACGSLLLTNDLTDNGQDELFRDGMHLATYGGPEELLDKIAYYLKREEVRERIAAAGRDEVLAKHTYGHRMETLLDHVRHALPAAASARVSRPTERTRPAKDRTYFDFLRPELLPLVPASASRVLEVGCATGRFAEALKARQQVEVTGIELDEDAASAAEARLDHVIVADVETLAENVFDAEFDCIVCGDVLEHLQAPGRFLKKARRWLAPNGRLVASIPNARHHSVISSLLDGNWTYEPAGLLDDSHLQFFTRRDIMELFQTSGFELRQLQVVPGPGHEQWQRLGRPGQIALGRLSVTGMPLADAEEFFVYQYLVVATPVLTSSPGLPHEKCQEPVRAVGRPTQSFSRTQKPDQNDRTPNESAVGGARVVHELGCILAIRNRPAECLERTLQTYTFQQVQPGDKLLLDYGSKSKSHLEYRRLCRRYGWRLMSVEPEEPRWILAAAYNHAILALSPVITVVFKSDVDILLGQGVLESAASIGKDKYCQFCCYKTCEGTLYPRAFQQHSDVIELLNGNPPPRPTPGDGVHAYPRAWFESIGGFDLEYRSFGYEDHDLRMRATWSVGVAYAKHALLVHQWHPPSHESHDMTSNREYFERMVQRQQVVRNGGRLFPALGVHQPTVESSVDFVIKSFLRPAALLRLLQSVRRYYPTVLITITDDGNLQDASDEDSRRCRQLIEDDPRCVLHVLPFDSVGPADGRNYLVEHTSKPYILLLDDDYCLTEQTRIETLLDALRSNETIGVIGGMCVDIVDGKEHPRRFAGTLDIRDGDLTHTVGEWRDPARKFCDIVLQFAMFRREVFQEVRWRGGPGAHHYDLFLQLKEADWNVCQEDSVVIHHYPYTAALPGYRERRDNVGPGQMSLLQKWNVDRLLMSGKVLCSCKPDRAVNVKSGETFMPTHFDKYDRLGAYHWDEFEQDTTYREHALRVQQWITEEKVLDVGAGDGLITHLLIQKGLRATGIDNNRLAVKLANDRGVPISYGDIYDLAGSFDAVYAGDVLEHLENPSRALQEIGKVTNLLYVATPPRGLDPKDRFHVHEFTQSELREFMWANGWRETSSTVANARILARFVRDPVVVYTAIFGGKDSLQEPAIMPPNCEFVCFSDERRYSDTWNVVVERPQARDPCRAAKVYKILPHRFFDHSHSVWIDGMFQLRGDVNDLFPHLQHDFAAFRHEARDCIYAEAHECIKLAKDDPTEIMSQVDRYRREDYPLHNGLISCGFLLRKHNPQIEEVNELWWNEVVSGSKRDQLSFNYVAWKKNLQYSVIPGEIWHNKYLKHYPHRT